MAEVEIQTSKPCPSKACNGELGGKEEIYEMRLNGLYYLMEKFYCPKCRSRFSLPLSIMTREEYRKIKRDREKVRAEKLEKARQMVRTI